MTSTNKTKAELLEIIAQKENEILDLKDELRLFEKCVKYDNIADEIRDVYDKLGHKGFTGDAALDIVKTMLMCGLINDRTNPRNTYVSYRPFR